MSTELERRLIGQADRQLSARFNGPLSGRDLWRLIGKVSAEHRTRNRDEWEELRSRLACSAADWIAADSADRWLLRSFRADAIRTGAGAAAAEYGAALWQRRTATDRERLEIDLRAAVAPELDSFRAERGYHGLPQGSGTVDPENGTDLLGVMLDRADGVAIRAAERAVKSEPRAGLKGDPAEPWLRAAIRPLTARSRAAIGAALQPEAHSAEWARAERCGPVAWRKRGVDGRKHLSRSTGAYILAGLIGGLETADGGPRREPLGEAAPRPEPLPRQCYPLPDRWRDGAEPEPSRARAVKPGRFIPGQRRVPQPAPPSPLPPSPEKVGIPHRPIPLPDLCRITSAERLRRSRWNGRPAEVLAYIDAIGAGA